ncbi:MAG: BppU family phage baseplate upper protein [Cellulosilyticaceae bacterium]
MIVLKAKSYTILMDIYKGVLNPQDIRFVTEDNGQCTLNFKILEDKMAPYDLTGCIVRMLIDEQQQDCTTVSATDGTVKIELEQSMFAVAGDYKAELQIYDIANQTKRLTTPTFRYNVRKSMMDDETVQADPHFSILQGMIINVSNANDLANQAKSVADSALATANTAVNNVATIQAKGDYAKQQGDYAKQQGDSMVPYQQEITHKINILDQLPAPADRTKNGFYLQNRDVVQDGLIVESYNLATDTDVITKVFQKAENEITIIMKLMVGSLMNNGGWIALFNTLDNAYCGEIQVGNGKIFVYLDKTYYSTNALNIGQINTIVINIKDNELSITVNGVVVKYTTNFTTDIGKIILGKKADRNILYGKLNTLIYNRPLSQQEIKYNFDSMGKNKVQAIEKDDGTEYALSALAEDIFFDNGMNLDRAMNQFISWKTLTMREDGTFPVTKCADWKSNRYKVMGNTVKQISKNYATFSANDINKPHYKLAENNETRTASVTMLDTWTFTSWYYFGLGNKIQDNIQTSKDYTVFIKYKVPKLTSMAVIIQNGGADFRCSNSVSYQFTSIDGIAKIKLTTLSSFVGTPKDTFVYITSAFGELKANDVIEFQLLGLLEGDYTNSNLGFLPFGLNSVGTTTLDGKTCLLYSVNGVTNCFELPQPSRKWDTLKDGVDVIGTEEIVAKGTESWSINDTAQPNTIRFMLNGVKTEKSTEGICNLLEVTSTGNVDKEATIVVGGVWYVRILKSKASNLEQFKLYLNQLSNAGTPLTIQYPIIQPISQEIKSTFAYGPGPDGNADIRFTDAVIPSAAEITVAQTADQVNEQLNNRVTALENALLLLQSK